MAANRAKQPDTLEDLQGIADRTADWIRDNPIPILAALGGILLLAAGVGAYSSYSDSQEDAAAADLARAQSEYRLAMGAGPGDVEIPEPANPETGQRIRGEYVERFLSIAEEHSGTGAGVLASMAAGELKLELGEAEAGLALWQEALDGLAADAPMRGILAERIAEAEEKAGRWLEAAQAHEMAGGIASFPLRYWSLLDAARCYAEAGEEARALALYERVKAEAPDLQPPTHVKARFEVLSRSAAEAPAPADTATPTDG